MQTTRWNRWLAVGVMVVPIVARAQGAQPVIKPLGTIPGIAAGEVRLMPNGHVVLVGDGDSLFAFDLTTKRSTLVARPWNYGTAISPRGDRVAYLRASETGDDYIWSIPVDPANGMPRGAPQRVATQDNSEVSFSSDGRSLVYATRIQRGQFDLGVVPATGGPSRVLMTNRTTMPRGIFDPFWSSDGKWLFAQIHLQDTIEALVRLPVAGGAAETLTTFPRGKDLHVGTAAGPVAFFWADPNAQADGHLSFVGPNAVRGQTQISPDAIPDLSAHSLRTILYTPTSLGKLHLLDLGSGATKEIAAPSIVPSSVQWFPDGRRFAALLANAELERFSRRLIVMNADGSGQRTFNVPSTRFLQPSPDGTTIALATAYQGISLLDLSTGRVRDLDTAIARTTLRWRSDSKAILVDAGIPIAGGAKRTVAVVSIGLDGTSKTLRNVTSEYPDADHADPLNDREALVYGRAMSPRFVVLPLNGGRGSPASTDPNGVGRAGQPHVSLDGETISLFSRGSQETMKLVLYTRSGELIREVQTPFTSVDATHFAMPDRLHVFVAAHTSSDTVQRYYMLPLDGGAPHLLSSVAHAATFNNFFSPDGKTLVYASVVAKETRIDAVDFTPVLRAAGIH